MKHLIFALGLIAMMTACNGKHDDANPDGTAYAAVDLPVECQAPTSVALPAEYAAAGCSAYGWQNGHFRHGGCPHRTFAACAPGVGMICMPQDIYREHQIAWFNYRDGVRRMSFCGYEGYANRGACSYRGIPGAGNIGRACIVGGVNECGFGHCEPLTSRGENRGRRGAGRRGGRHARIGVCIQ